MVNYVLCKCSLYCTFNVNKFFLRCLFFLLCKINKIKTFHSTKNQNSSVNIIVLGLIMFLLLGFGRPIMESLLSRTVRFWLLPQSSRILPGRWGRSLPTISRSVRRPSRMTTRSRTSGIRRRSMAIALKQMFVLVCGLVARQLLLNVSNRNVISWWTEMTQATTQVGCSPTRRVWVRTCVSAVCRLDYSTILWTTEQMSPENIV